MFIDAHTHLNLEDLFMNWKEHLSHFQNAGGKILVNAGAHTEYNSNGILIAQEAKQLFPELSVKATVGFHPEDISFHKEEQEEILEAIQGLEQQYLDHPDEIIAIGECGIDLHGLSPLGATSGTKGIAIEQQQKYFRLQAELARKLGLPLVIHSRDGFAETLEVLNDFRDLKIYFHCWGYGPEEIRIAEELFPQVWFGFTNIVSYPSAKKTRESLLTAQQAHLLMETDAPFLPPQAFRGKTNYPAYISYVYATCAEVLGIDQEQLEQQVEENFRTLFSGQYYS